MDQVKLHELIERYLSSTLEGEEKANFEREIANNAVLSKEVELERSLLEAAGNQKLNEFYELSKDVIYANDFGTQRNNYLFWIVILFSSLLVASLFIYLKGNKQELQFDVNIVQQASIEQINPFEQSLRSEIDINNDTELLILWDQYFTAFNEKDFDSAQEYLEEVSQIEQDNVPLIYQQALFLIIDEDYESAIPLLHKSKTSNDFSMWLLALCYLEIGDEDNGVVWLKRVSEQIHPRQEEAIRLLELL